VTMVVSHAYLPLVALIDIYFFWQQYILYMYVVKEQSYRLADYNLAYKKQ
jgi:hypothetical protein